MKKKFSLQQHSQVDKSFAMNAPDDFEIYIEIDFDDVWHPKVNKEAKAIVKVLNNHMEELKTLIEK